MDDTTRFSENLKKIKEVRQLSLMEYSEELQVPKSTLQSILNYGHTTLDTACQIANSLGIPLSTLLGGTLSDEKMKILHGLLLGLDWYSKLSGEDQRKIAEHLHTILEVLQK